MKKLLSVTIGLMVAFTITSVQAQVQDSTNNGNPPQDTSLRGDRQSDTSILDRPRSDIVPRTDTATTTDSTWSRPTGINNGRDGDTRNPSDTSTWQDPVLNDPMQKGTPTTPTPTNPTPTTPTPTTPTTPTPTTPPTL